jgi:ribonuclease E
MDAIVADMNGSAAPGQPGTAKRKRRRRRGKRGGTAHAGGAEHAQQSEANSSYAPHANDYDRFGIPDEIDTTPREEPRPQPVIERVDADEPAAIPNAASTPVWSLTAEPDAGPSPPPQRTPEPVAEAVAEESAPESVSTQPAGPPKKGWWQRTFRTES